MPRAPAYWHTACAELAAADPVMATLIARYPDCVLGTRSDPFHTLARAIVGQQISVKAADSIWARFEQCAESVVPDRIAALEAETLAACGLSRRKVEYLQDLAGHFLDGRIQPTRWKKQDDETVIAELIDVRGIGRWTAEMFLIFNLRRPDVWPVDDIGLQKAVALHYLEGERPGLAALRAHGLRHAPWRTVATWYLWRSLDPVVVQY
ncbi:MAG: DNA-3-methyladenine glycosylase [Hydrogenophilales bacterium 16-64-46]|nr:MAG: DNA-3-methyladenine glycosylase [Hydrogenophilales bacterium 12-64-13]OYZ05365.1 MAG: DNA-3-methyladenine glycosylase [Hydrogenophilales bacterium 16-64-46]OZA37719.1 MAG: DNA-3-methyladenine glycosylase [Hydrogenophilales bacterium 17-64-34]